MQRAFSSLAACQDLTDGDHGGGLDPHALAVATGLSSERAPSAGTMLRHASWDERRQMKTGASRLLNKRGRRKVVWRKDVAYFRSVSVVVLLFAALPLCRSWTPCFFFFFFRRFLI